MSAADVLVVGAGPAGSVAALLLARAGLRVRLLDRARFPRFKLCGDTLNPGALALLRAVDLATWRDVTARGLPIAGMTVTGPGGARVTAGYPAGIAGVAISRSELDRRLLDTAIAAGVQFDDRVAVLGPIVEDGLSDGVLNVSEGVASGFGRTGLRVTGVRIGGGRQECTLAARLVIAADGRASRLGSALQLSHFAPRCRRWAFGAYYTGVSGLSDRGEMHIQRGGYLGIAPLPGGIANVCVVRELPPGSSAAAAPVGAAARGLSPVEVIARAVAADPALRQRFNDAEPCMPGTVLGPLARDADAAGVPGLLLAGDAAGFVDPMTGDGLRFAIRGAVLAAEAALGELASGAPAYGALAAARRREFAAKWRINRGLRLLVGSPRGVALAAALTARWAAPVRLLVGIAGDVPLATREAASGVASSVPEISTRPGDPGSARVRV